MSQHDQNIANDTGAAVRTDLNNALGALFTLSSGATAPATTIAHMFWADTTSGTLKRRNAANTGWIVVRTLDESFVLSRSANTILDVSDTGKVIVATGTFTQTFDAAATLGDGWSCGYRNDSTGVITLDPNLTETIDGAATITLQPGEACLIYCSGTAFKTISRRRINDLTADATPDGAADFVETWDASATAHKKVLLSNMPMPTVTSAQLAAAVTDETGTGALVFATSPTLVTPALGTPASGVLTNCTGYPAASDTATGAIEIAVQSEMEAPGSTTSAVTPGRQHYHPGHPKAWAYFGVTGNLVSNYNITSVTDTGAGDATVNWNVDFSTANYAKLVTLEDSSTNSLAVHTNAVAAGTVQVQARTTDGAGTLTDPVAWNVVAMGDH